MYILYLNLSSNPHYYYKYINYYILSLSTISFILFITIPQLSPHMFSICKEYIGFVVFT